MQGPLGIPSDQTAAFGRGVEKGGREVAPYLADLMLSLNVAGGARTTYKGYKYLRDAVRANRASQVARNLGNAKKTEALILQAVRKTVPDKVTRGQVQSTVRAANKQFRKAKRLASEGQKRGVYAKRNLRDGSKKLRHLGSAAKGASAANDAARVKDYVESRPAAQTQDLTYVQQLRRYRGRR